MVAMSAASAAALVVAAALAVVPARADVYMHNPRGSNGRGCRNSNSAERSGDEAQRLFDSQNNDKGGYSCGAAYPFACYTELDEAARAACNAKNTAVTDEEAKALVNEDGTLKDTTAVNTPKMYFFAGSVLPIEWTAQHGSGTNSKVNSDIIIQVACEGDSPGVYSFTDDCGGDGTKACHPRDGTAVSNTDEVNTQRIPETAADQDNYRYGRHESLRFYERCKNLERNKGLWVADQNVKGNDARFTRQNPNGARNGLECPEESEYYPYWQPSPWIDVAIVTSNSTKCEADKQESQNVKDKFFCDCEDCQGIAQLPNHERHCVEKGGTWKPFAAWSKVYDGVSAPECLLGAFSRDNHLGNVASDGQPFHYNWTIPAFLAGKDRCVLRVRYNMSSADQMHAPVYADSKLNGKLSPLLDRDENPEGVYLSMSNLCDANEQSCALGLAVNTNQYGRTFQDRSHIFRIKERPAEPDCDKIYNLNVRGKRGNIVQTYPAVEYDFVPNNLNVTEADCIHVQWTGSDYNPNRNPNNAEGGPPNPVSIDQSKSDRSNLVQMADERENAMLREGRLLSMFVGDRELFRRLAFVDQPIHDPAQCLPYATLRELNNNNNDATDRDHRNCMKLSAARTPYFDAGLLKPRQGVHRYMSSRNNNFSNRGQKGVLFVARAPGLSGGAIAGIVIGSIAAVGLLVAAAVVCYPKWKARGGAAATVPPRKQQEATDLSTCSASTAGSRRGAEPPASAAQFAALAAPGAAANAQGAGLGSPIKSSATSPAPDGQPPVLFAAVALYEYKGAEAGELSFAVGDVINVLRQDSSGWWEGRLRSGVVGVFPSNYVERADDASAAQVKLH